MTTPRFNDGCSQTQKAPTLDDYDNAPTDDEDEDGLDALDLIERGAK